MVTDRSAHPELLIVGHLKGAVVLCEPFVEPERRVLKSVFDQQVCVLVKDDRERILAATHFYGVRIVPGFRGQRYVVDVRSRLKVTRNVWQRLERSIRIITLENDHRGGNG